LSDKKAIINLRTVAERVGLAPCSVSAILNRTPAAEAIPQHTKDRVFRAAAELNYRPNLAARSLRTKRTRMIAAVTSDMGLAPIARVLAGVQDELHRRGYLMAVRSFDGSSEWHSISVQLHQRGIEGVVAVDAILPPGLGLPVASVELGPMRLMAPFPDETRARLSGIGESAAQAVVHQIEKKAEPRRVTITPGIRRSSFTLARTAGDLETRDGASGSL